MTPLGATLAIALLLGSLSLSTALRGRRDVWALIWPAAFTLWATLTANGLVAAASGVKLDTAGILLAPSIGALGALIVLLLPARLGRIAAAIWVSLASLLAFASVLFFRQFGMALPAEMLARAPDAWLVRDAVGALLVPADAWLALPALAALAVLVVGERAPHTMRVPRPIVIGCAVLALPSLLFATRGGLRTSDPGRHPMLALQKGYLVAQLSDVWAAEWERRGGGGAAAREAARALVEARRGSARESDQFGRARGANVVLIQVESLNAWVLDARVANRPIAPSLVALCERGLCFRDVLDQTGSGRSSDADHLALVSQHPLPRVPVAIAAVENEIVALPSVSSRAGYTTAVVSADPRGLWSIARRARRYGFQHGVFQDGLGPGEMIGFFHGDRVVFERAAELVEGVREPFLLRVSTMSMHSPYTPLPPALDVVDLGELEQSPLGNYLDRVAYFDRALGRFVARIERRFPGTLIVLHGDHAESHGLDRERVRAISGNDVSHPGRVPLIFVHPRLDRPESRPTTLGLIDVAPSVLELLGIDKPPSFLGTSAFGKGPSFVARWDGFVIGAETWDGERCLTRAASTPLDARACDGLRARARAELEASWFLTRASEIPNFAKTE